MPEMWQKVAKFKGAEYFRKALYIVFIFILFYSQAPVPAGGLVPFGRSSL